MACGNILDGFVKSPDAALRFILPLPSQGQAYCGVRQSTPHSSGFARLACGTFYEAVQNLRLLLLFTSPSSCKEAANMTSE